MKEYHGAYEKKVMVFGAFDILHEGHLFFLKKAKEYGKLIVIVARDSNIRKLKGKEPHHDENSRKEILQQTGIPSQVELGFKDDFIGCIKKHRPDIICLGYDQKFPAADTLKKIEDAVPEIRIVRIDSYHPDRYKSSIIREKSENMK